MFTAYTQLVAIIPTYNTQHTTLNTAPYTTINTQHRPLHTPLHSTLNPHTTPPLLPLTPTLVTLHPTLTPHPHPSHITPPPLPLTLLTLHHYRRPPKLRSWYPLCWVVANWCWLETTASWDPWWCAKPPPSLASVSRCLNDWSWLENGPNDSR